MDVLVKKMLIIKLIALIIDTVLIDARGGR